MLNQTDQIRSLNKVGYQIQYEEDGTAPQRGSIKMQ